MDRLDELTRHDPALQEEVKGLDLEQRRWLANDLEQRALARTLAAKLGLDEGDVYHQLKQLERSPAERLRTGLAHGRRRAAQHRGAELLSSAQRAGGALPRGGHGGRAIDGVEVHLMLLPRILHRKRAAKRTKDEPGIHPIEVALEVQKALQEESEEP